MSRSTFASRQFRAFLLVSWFSAALAGAGGAEILFFDDPAEFEAALAAGDYEVVGVEDFEDAAIEFPEADPMADPLDTFTDNGLFAPGDILASLRIQANTLGGDASGESPRGGNALFVRAGTGGTTSKQATHNFGSDSYDVIALAPVTAMSFDFVVTTKISIPDGQIQVWSDDATLLAEGFSAASGSGVYVGILATEGETLDRVNLYNNFAFSAYVGVDNLIQWGPPTGQPLAHTGFDPGTAGGLNTLTASGATPGEQVFFVAGLGSGATEVPGCAPLELDLDLLLVLGSSLANASGIATLDVDVPGTAAGNWVLTQAVEATSCLKSELGLTQF